LSNSNIVLNFLYWPNGASEDAGGGSRMRATYDSHYHQLVVSRPADNRVTLLKMSYDHQAYLPLIRR
jgi:hypothetical protein